MPTKPIIVCLDDFENIARASASWEAIEAAAEVRIHTAPLTGEALLAALRPADVVVLMRDRTPFREPLIARLPNLKLVVFTGTRNNTLDTAALARRGIPVCHTAWGPSKDSTTEIVWALILAAQKKLERYLPAMRAGQWRLAGDPLLPVLHGKTIGLVGLGEIGQRVARVAQAFGMKVITWSPNMTPERAAAVGATAVSFDALVRSADVVSLHLVLSEKTRHLFGEAQFKAMKPGALFVNTARAGLVDESALIASLKNGTLAHAALDVFEQEPMPTDHPLLSLPNVTLTPHLGFVCEPVFAQFYEGITECLTAWLHGKPLPRVLAT